MIFEWAGRLSADYQGGNWDFFELSNGGFYLAPNQEALAVQWHPNGFQGILNADAFGIVVTLFTLCHLAEMTDDSEFVDSYHQLRDYALTHREASLIFRAID